MRLMVLAVAIGLSHTAALVTPAAPRGVRATAPRRLVPACKLETSSRTQLQRTNGAVGMVAPIRAAEVEEGTGQIPASSLLVLGLCCAIGSVCALDRVMISIAILPMGAEFGFSDGTKGLVASAFSVGYCLGLFPAGVAASKGSPKTVLGAGLLIWSVAQALTPTAAAAGLPALCGARALMGLGEAAAVPCLQSLAATFVPASVRGKFWGFLTACLSLGTISAYLLTPPIMDGAGWPAAFELFGGAGLLIALAWAVGGADGPEDASPLARVFGATAAPVAPAARVAAESTAAADEPVPWRQMAASRPVWALAAAHMSCNFFNYFSLWLPTYFNYQFGLTASDAASASLVPFAAAAAASFTAGSACDALVARGLSLTAARKVMQSVSCLGPAAAMLVLAALSESVGGLRLSRDEAELLFVAAQACSASAAAGYGCGAQDLAKRYASLLYGATSVFAVLAGASGQYLTGWLLEANGRDFAPMFVLTAVVELAGFAAWNAWWSSEREFE